MTETYEAEMRRLVKRFFDAVAQADYGTVSDSYAPDVVIWHNFDNVAQSREENLAVLSTMPQRLSDIRYDERRVEVFDGGFVQQHVLRATRKDGVRVAMPAVIVCRVANGKIVRLDEYLDSAHVAEFRKVAA
jgi:ketosteroid isomerase-like protein